MRDSNSELKTAYICPENGTWPAQTECRRSTTCANTTSYLFALLKLITLAKSEKTILNVMFAVSSQISLINHVCITAVTSAESCAPPRPRWPTTWPERSTWRSWRFSHTLLSQPKSRIHSFILNLFWKKRSVVALDVSTVSILERCNMFVKKMLVSVLSLPGCMTSSVTLAYPEKTTWARPTEILSSLEP